LYRLIVIYIVYDAKIQPYFYIASDIFIFFTFFARKTCREVAEQEAVGQIIALQRACKAGNVAF